jgi:3D (Asp-Asp-Asp) domain-containing protein
MAKWLVWLLAVTTAIFASPLSLAQQSATTLARTSPCSGVIHCDGPPGYGWLRPSTERKPSPPALLRADVHLAPRILTPAQMAPSLTLGTAPGDVLSVDGRTFSIVKRIQMLASTYTTGEPGVGTVTYTGTRARVGEVAVDPRFLPLGTWMFVTGYHTPDLPPQGILEHAEDIGGAIKGDRLDIYLKASFHDLAEFGGQWVTVYILVPRVAGTSPAMPVGAPH